MKSFFFKVRVVVIRVPLPQQTKESARRGAGLSAICFYCVSKNHMAIDVSLSAICFYCIGKNHLLRNC